MKSPDSSDYQAQSGQRYICPLCALSAIMEGMNLFWRKSDIQFADDSNATLSMYVRAGKDANGEFAFDDGQDCLLTLETSSGNYPLFPRRFVQLGRLFCTLYNNWNDKSDFVSFHKKEMDKRL